MYVFFPPLLHPCALSLSRMPAVPPLCFSKLPAPSLSPSAFLPGVHREDFVTAGGQVVARSLSTPPRPTATTTKKERGRDTYKSRRLRPTEQTLPSLSQCDQGVSTGELDFTVAHSAPSHDPTPRAILYFSVSRAHTHSHSAAAAAAAYVA